MRDQILTKANKELQSGCSDPVIGAILSGWRYDISGISPEMRTDYESHLDSCAHCQRRQTVARSIDVLLISVSTLSIVAFLLAAVLLHRIELISPRLEALSRIGTLHVHLHQTAITVSLQAVAVAGVVISSILWILVAIATPLPGFLNGLLQERLPSDLRDRFTRRHA